MEDGKRTRKKRRSDEEILAELKAKVQAIRRRARIQEAMKSPAVKRSPSAVVERNALVEDLHLGRIGRQLDRISAKIGVNAR